MKIHTQEFLWAVRRRTSPDQYFVDQDAEGIDVCRRGCLLTFEDLRGDVLERSNNLSRIQSILWKRVRLPPELGANPNQELPALPLAGLIQWLAQIREWIRVDPDCPENERYRNRESLRRDGWLRAGRARHSRASSRDGESPHHEHGPARARYR